MVRHPSPVRVRPSGRGMPTFPLDDRLPTLPWACRRVISVHPSFGWAQACEIFEVLFKAAWLYLGMIRWETSERYCTAVRSGLRY
jgi:hypothetical protein